MDTNETENIYNNSAIQKIISMYPNVKIIHKETADNTTVTILETAANNVIGVVTNSDGTSQPTGVTISSMTGYKVIYETAPSYALDLGKNTYNLQDIVNFLKNFNDRVTFPLKKQ